MLERYLNIATHPLLWIFIGLTVVFYGVQWLVNPGPDHQHRSFDTTGWLRRNYVAIVFALGGAAIVLALVFYVFEVGIAVARLVDRLRLGAAGDLTETEAKDLAYGIAVLLGAMVAAATIPFTLLRTWINERTATATEEGLITDRINKAVEGLGAEKTVDRIGRPITIWTGKPETVTHQVDDPDKFTLPPRAIETRRYRKISQLGHPDNEQYHDGLHVDVKAWPDEKTMIEWQGTNTSVSENEHLGKVGDWQVFTETQPNLEVRIGAIYALERISQDSARDHIQIMEILCAYIRQNAPTDLAKPLQTADLSTPAKYMTLPGGSTPRVDIQAAISVIGRRALKRSEHEKREGYRSDLRRCNLQNVDFQSGNWACAIFDGSVLDQANLAHSDFESASLANCSFENTNFKGAKLKGVRARGAKFRFIQIAEKAENIGLLKDVDNLAAEFDSCIFNSIIIENDFHATILKNSDFNWCQFTHGWFFAIDTRKDLESCRFTGCSVRDLSISLGGAKVMIDRFFGDASVRLPDEVAWPKHWPKHWLNVRDFEAEWRKWQADPDNYTPPVPPEEG